MAHNQETQREINEASKKAVEKVFYSLMVTWDAEKGMQIQQNSQKAGPADIILALEVVSGMHKKYFIDAFSQNINKQVMENLTDEQKNAIRENMDKVLKKEEQ